MADLVAKNSKGIVRIQCPTGSGKTEKVIEMIADDLLSDKKHSYIVPIVDRKARDEFYDRLMAKLVDNPKEQQLVVCIYSHVDALDHFYCDNFPKLDFNDKVSLSAVPDRANLKKKLFGSHQ